MRLRPLFVSLALAWAIGASAAAPAEAKRPEPKQLGQQLLEFALRYRRKNTLAPAGAAQLLRLFPPGWVERQHGTEALFEFIGDRFWSLARSRDADERWALEFLVNLAADQSRGRLSRIPRRALRALFEELRGVFAGFPDPLAFRSYPHLDPGWALIRAAELGDASALRVARDVVEGFLRQPPRRQPVPLCDLPAGVTPAVVAIARFQPASAGAAARAGQRAFLARLRSSQQIPGELAEMLRSR